MKDIGQLPAEVLAFQGNATLDCGLGVSQVCVVNRDPNRSRKIVTVRAGVEACMLFRVVDSTCAPAMVPASPAARYPFNYQI